MNIDPKAAMAAALVLIGCSSPRAEEPAKVVGRVMPAAASVSTATVSNSMMKAGTANPDASADAKRILDSLRGLQPGATNSVLVGQNMGHIEYLFEENLAAYYTGTKEKTGKLPAIFAIDYGYEPPQPYNLEPANKVMAEHCEAGGLVTISLHPKNPFTGGDVGDRSTGGHPFEAILGEDPGVRARWLETLDAVAAGLKDLEQRGVTVLWRPLHEMNGDWFWWSVGMDGNYISNDQFTALWRDMFDYFTNDKGLNNLLWVYAANAQLNDTTKPTDYYYPGDDVVDIVALDYYYNDFSMLNNNGGYDRLARMDKPMGFGEVGPANWAKAHPKGNYDTLQVINAIRTDFPKVRYFTFWNGWKNGRRRAWSAIVENQNPEKLMSSPEVVTLDEMTSVMGQRSCN